MRKEDLQKQIGQVENQIREWKDNDEIIRKNVSQFLGSFQSQQNYNHTRDVKILRWAEIYFELGKLTAVKNFYDFEGNLSELECKLEDLENKIRKEIHPNL